MKIAFLTHSVFSDGGVQRVVTTVANELSKTYNVDIICTNENIKEDRDKYKLSEDVRVIFNDINRCEKYKEIILRSFRFLNRKFGLFNNKYLYKFLSRIYYPKYQQNNIKNLINNNKYDVIVGCEGYYALLMGVIKNNGISARVFSWHHNSYDVYLKNKGKYYWNEDILFSKLLKNVDRNIVLTKYDKKLFEKILGVRSIALYNPLSFKCDIKSNQKNKIIICAGRLEKRKGMDLLIKSFAKIDDKNGWKLLIVGSGEMKEELEKLIIDLNVKRYVTIIPFNKDIKKYMVNSSIYAMASRAEGFGLVVTEALEAGLPVISFNTTGPSEILENKECGIIVDNFKIDRYCNALKELMFNDKKRILYSQNAIVRAKDFEKNKIIEEWKNILEEKEEFI